MTRRSLLLSVLAAALALQVIPPADCAAAEMEVIVLAPEPAAEDGIVPGPDALAETADTDGAPDPQANAEGPPPAVAPAPGGGASPATTADPAAAAPEPAPGPVCTEAKRKALAKAAAGSHKGVYYDNKFEYLADPCYGDSLLGDRLKRNAIGDWAIVDFGGEYRLRQHSERNIRGLGLTGRDDDFLLHRTRLYANLEVADRLRFYAEMNDAASNYERFPPRAIEEDRTELQNLFADYVIAGSRAQGLAARLGRQELLYGNQRTVSPLDWANTRRTFEGYKAFWKGQDWDVDAFWVQPIYPNPRVFDTPDQSQQFMGLYATHRLSRQEKADWYYLRLVETDAPANFDFHTLGFRREVEHGPWLGEVEAAVQFGSFGAENHSAGMYTFGLGRKFDNLPWKPVLWAYYDWASGDAVIGNGYHHLFPLAHKYLGWMDLYGRRNIEDLNFQLVLQPREKWKLWAWWHVFRRQNPLDVPYNVNMTPFVPAPGGSGELGQELDLLATWTFDPRMELGLGYSHFFTGAFYGTNPSPPPYSGDADFYYTQLSVRF